MLAVCEPWPLKSRGLRELEVPREFGRVVPARAEHLVVAAHELLGADVAGPVPFRGDRAASGRGSGSAPKLAFSGQKPESRMPTMTPSPARAVLPNSFAQVPPAPERPRKAGVETVSTESISFSVTRSTPLVCASRVASARVSSAAKPLKVMA